MFALASPKRVRAAFVAVLTLLGAGAAVASSADPALALCKYGSPNCVNPNPGPQPPGINRNRIPDSNWVDPDCKYYGNCQSPNSARRAPGGRVTPGGKVLLKR